jgi:hypothetical protein
MLPYLSIRVVLTAVLNRGSSSIRRFAAAAVLAEELEVQLARGEEVDIARHALLCSTLVRIAQRTGLHRVPRDVAPSLAEYLDAKSAEPEPEEDAE